MFIFEAKGTFMIVGTKSRIGDFFKINFSRLRFLYPNEFSEIKVNFLILFFDQPLFIIFASFFQDQATTYKYQVQYQANFKDRTRWLLNIKTLMIKDAFLIAIFFLSIKSTLIYFSMQSLSSIKITFQKSLHTHFQR